MTQEHWAFISIGSNMGDRLRYCCEGLKTLCADGSVRLARLSPFYETAPVDFADQDWFINAAAKIDTRLTPPELLRKLQAVQAAAGRRPHGVRFGPRVLDLDIIFYEDQVIQTPGLVIPHPRMHKRRFVLKPLCDIDAAVFHPLLGRQVHELLNQMDEREQPIRPCSSSCSL